jgi:Protein of unknown function (DUF3719)
LLQISPTNSQCSSVGSLPWAEDSILENKEEWEKIERIFYGEEDLPTGERRHIPFPRSIITLQNRFLDKQTREEFQEWMTAFPHIRVVGQPMNYYFDDLVRPSDENYDETFAIDPPMLANPPGLEIECKKLSLNERRNQLKIDDNPAAVNLFDFREGANDFNKYLRIASGAVVGRSQMHVKNMYVAKPQHSYFQPNYIEKIKTYEIGGADTVFGRYIPPAQPRIYEKAFAKNIYSARLAPLELSITKMPFTLISSGQMTPVISLAFVAAGDDVDKPKPNVPVSASRRPTRLPTLQRAAPKFQNEIVGRSISAVSRSDGRVGRQQFDKIAEAGHFGAKPKEK